jgi:hypothetical protein
VKEELEWEEKVAEELKAEAPAPAVEAKAQAGD